MVTRKGVNISSHYVVSINAIKQCIGEMDSRFCNGLSGGFR